MSIGLTLVAGAYATYKTLNDPYTIKGELAQDYIQNLGSFGELYRIVVQTDKGLISYPILGEPNEIRDLERNLVSRGESPTHKGDTIAINPKSSVFSLDEVILLPENIKKQNN